MKKIVISSGHGTKVRGASGYIDEVDEAIRVMERTAQALRAAGAQVITYTDTVSTSQSENLDRIVDFHNAQGPHLLRRLDTFCGALGQRRLAFGPLAR